MAFFRIHRSRYLLCALVLLGAARADAEGEVNASAVFSSAGAGAELGAKGQTADTHQRPFIYYSREAKLGVVAFPKLRLLGKLDYTAGEKNLRFTVARGEGTPNNVRADVLVGRFYLHPFTGGTTEISAGLVGAHHNYEIGGAGTWALRVVPVGVSHEQHLGDLITIKAALEHAFLLSVDDAGAFYGAGSSTTGSGYSHDLVGRLAVSVAVTPNLNVNLEGIVEDAKLKVIEGGDGGADRRLELKGNTAGTVLAGVGWEFQ